MIARTPRLRAVQAPIHRRGRWPARKWQQQLHGHLQMPISWMLPLCRFAIALNISGVTTKPVIFDSVAAQIAAGTLVLSPFAPGLAGRVNARRAIIRPGWRTVRCGA